MRPWVHLLTYLPNLSGSFRIRLLYIVIDV